MHDTPLLRRREAALQLAISESQVLALERHGVLHAIRIPGMRAVRYDAREVHRLAMTWVGQSSANGGRHSCLDDECPSTPPKE